MPHYTCKTAWIGLLLTAMSGCVNIRNMHEDLYTRREAHQAYKSACHPDSLSTSRDFERGWKQGYYDVILGMPPCPPSTPPEAYWGPKFNGPAGRQAIAEWFAGYQAGACVASGNCPSDTIPAGPYCERPPTAGCFGPACSVVEGPAAFAHEAESTPRETDDPVPVPARTATPAQAYPPATDSDEVPPPPSVEYSEGPQTISTASWTTHDVRDAPPATTIRRLPSSHD